MRVSALTTFGLGGESREVVFITSPAELVITIEQLKKAKQKYALIAGGSNVVWQDAPFKGVVIKYWAPGSLGKNVLLSKNKITCDSSVPLADLIKIASNNNLAGLESLSGIPGTVGGAVVGNAGAYGQGISDNLTAVEIWDGKKIKILNKKQCRFKYRDSILKHKNWLVLSLTFELKPGDKSILTKRAKEIIKLREKKYPPGLKCPGSFFKNIVATDLPKAVLKKIDPAKITHGKIPAGYLLEEVGAKGLKEGGVMVATYHGNLLVNLGGGKTKEVKRLAAKLKNKVMKRFSLRLQEEIRYLPN